MHKLHLINIKHNLYICTSTKIGSSQNRWLLNPKYKKEQSFHYFQLFLTLGHTLWYPSLDTYKHVHMDTLQGRRQLFWFGGA